MVVDDDVHMVQATRRSLEHDHDVTCAVGGLVALSLVASGLQAFDVILCDLRMSGMSGEDLFFKIGKISPELAERMIFVSGDLTSPTAKRFLEGVPNARFEKPVNWAEVRRNIRTHVPDVPAR
ncbi:MAG: response regulator [Polyangiaceae bacterium]